MDSLLGPNKLNCLILYTIFVGPLQLLFGVHVHYSIYYLARTFHLYTLASLEVQLTAMY